MLIKVCNIIYIVFILWTGVECTFYFFERLRAWYTKKRKVGKSDEPLVLVIFYLLTGIFCIVSGITLALTSI